MNDAARNANFELDLDAQSYGKDPLEDRDTDLYRGEYIMSFVEKWDELIDWTARAETEGQFFIDVLRARGKETVLDVACRHRLPLGAADRGRLQRHLRRRFRRDARQGVPERPGARALILKTVQADWRWLNRDIQGKYDAIICLGNSFTHLHEERTAVARSPSSTPRSSTTAS